MKTTVNIARVLVGALFIFSGLVKAIDPLGLAYKMQEFFEVWAGDGFLKGLMMWLHGHALWFSLLVITLEVVLGVALLIGWKIKPVSWLLLLLMLFFTFLTSYVLFSGKIRACGCFGDCIPLTPIQTFTKDIILLLLVLLILFRQKYITPLFSNMISLAIVLLSIIAVAGLQWYVLRHLPVKDCLPYKKGNDLLKLREMPADAVPDKYEYSFIYQKNGEKKEFNTSNLPDSTWKFVDRKETVIKGKNNVPLINDFSLMTPDTVLIYEKNSIKKDFAINNLPDSSWTFKEKRSSDSTTTVLSQNGEYYLLFIKDLENYPQKWDGDIQLIEKAVKQNKPIYIVTGQPQQVKERFAGKCKIDGKNYDPLIFTCDVTVIKTAARANPAVFVMKGAVVQEKWSWADFEKIIIN